MQKIAGLAFALLLLALPLLAQPAPQLDFANGPAQWLMLPEEQKAWRAVKTEEQAHDFVDLFWARRDPTPGTPGNEFRGEFDNRVAFADARFKEGRKRGAMTDRGRVLITLGFPSNMSGEMAKGAGMSGNDVTVAPVDAQRGGAGSSMTGNRTLAAKDTWIYNHDLAEKFGAPKIEVVFIHDETGRVRRDPQRTDFTSVLLPALKSYLTSPDLTVVPEWARSTNPAVVAAAVPFTGEVFKGAGVTYTEMLTPKGEYFVPVQLYVPASAGIGPAQAATFFGTVKDAAGAVATSFNEPAHFAMSNGDLYFDRSLNLAPGKYSAELGLSDGTGRQVVLASTDLDLTPLSKDQPGITDVVVASDVHQMDSAAPAGAPYALGKMKIVPKGTLTFTNRDDVTYFVQVIAPTIDPATNLPKLQAKVEILGAARNVTLPMSDVDAQPMTGTPGPGQYAILSTLSLGAMRTPLPPGEYTLRIRIQDALKKQSWTTEKKLTITDSGKPS